MPCRKIAFDSRAHAMMIIRSSQKKVHGLRPYKCPSCGKWHLTRASRRAVKLRRKLGDNAPL